MENEKDLLTKKILKLKFKYREEEKKKFLEIVNRNSPKRTTMLYMSVLINVIDAAERKNEKEWMNFSEQMVDGTMIDLEAKSIITLQSYLSIIKDYLAATTPMIDDQLRGYDYTKKLSKESLPNYINTTGEKSQYITPNELKDIVFNRTGDVQSKCILILLYAGIKGESYKDLVNIKLTDIDLETRSIRLMDGSTVKIPKIYVDVINEAMTNNHYREYDNDGTTIKSAKLSATSPYLFRRSIYTGYDADIVGDMNFINKRIGALTKSIRNSYISGLSVYNSGITYRLLKRNKFETPAFKDFVPYRTVKDIKLSYNAMKIISGILIEKINNQ